MKHFSITIAVSLSLAIPCFAVEYEADILPIFTAKCSKCHMDGSSKGGVQLDLDKVTREIGMKKAIVPGNTEESDLFEVVSLPEGDNDIMPPEGKGRPLSSAEVAKIKEWIESGAAVGDVVHEMVEGEGEEKPSGDAPPKRPDPIDGNWTNNEGNTIKATLMRVEGDKAILRMNGKDYPYPISDLTTESQKIIREFAEAMSKSSTR